MAGLENDESVEGGDVRAKAPPEAVAKPDPTTAEILASINRLLEVDEQGPAAEPDRVAGLGEEIGRLLKGFDDRLAVVNRRLDRVLDRRI